MSQTTPNTSPLPFLLTGIPGLESLHVWISILLCITFILALLGNLLVLLAVGLDRGLHQPMLCFIATLAGINLIFSTAVVPKMLGVFWVGSREIGFEASGVLLAMSLDRYVAICHLLRYSTVLSGPRAIQAGLLSLLLISLPYCSSRVIPHSSCEHVAHTATSHRYSLSLATLLVGTDSAFITFSYGMILRAVLRLPSHQARLKALGTCGCHVFVILIFHIGGLLSMYLQMFTLGLAPHIQVLLADSYLLVLPMLNPLVYGIKVKQIQEGICKLLGQLTGHGHSKGSRGSHSFSGHPVPGPAHPHRWVSLPQI
uniref:G-protein coupled receptors family 1 profile domain-containing protein n=1 Tax=Malurus cyaneus samueli TaxID=2593467 RepID=A0A8C5TBJ5_9PASS